MATKEAILQDHKELFDLMADVGEIARELVKVQNRLAEKIGTLAEAQGLDLEQVAFER